MSETCGTSGNSGNPRNPGIQIIKTREALPSLKNQNNTSSQNPLSILRSVSRAKCGVLRRSPRRFHRPNATMSLSRKRTRPQLPVRSQRHTIDDSFSQPRSKGAKLDATAAPSVAQKLHEASTAPEDDDYVPVHLYANLEYRRRGDKELSATEIAAFELVETHYEVRRTLSTSRKMYLLRTFALFSDRYSSFLQIPKDFEKDSKYGPISGLSFEERVLAAYQQDKLRPKSAKVKICVACASVGHVKRRCPTLI
eukprot:scaffold323_cov232-Pinguiococcus_pyrenoidosus.AAC.4